MSLKLLAECIQQFERHGLEPEFQSYLLRRQSKLLASNDVARGLVALVVQEDDSSGHAYQILGLLLDEARLGLENDYAYAEDFLKAVEVEVQTGIAAGMVNQGSLMQFAGLYRSVGLPVPQSFVIDPDTMSLPPDMESIDLSGNLESAAREVMAEGGSAYDLFKLFDEMLAAAPQEIQAGLAFYLTKMDGPFFERCALFMLLAGPELVQKAIINGLSERLNEASLSADTLILLPMIRGWFPSGSVQTALDQIIKEARRKAISSQSHSTGAEIQEAVASIMDSVGAQSIAIRLKQGSKTMLAMILIKAKHGVKDGFLVPPENSDDAEHLIDKLRAQIGADDIATDTLRVLLEGALADGLENDNLPAPGFLDVIEACNLFDLRPQKLGLQALLNLADPDRKIQDASAQVLGRWINADTALALLNSITDSWFEDSKETREIIATGRTTRSIESKLLKFLETRRHVWAQRFLQTAVMLKDGGRLQEWKTLTASAYGLMNGRTLRRIPLMDGIMHITIEEGTMNSGRSKN